MSAGEDQMDEIVNKDDRGAIEYLKKLINSTDKNNVPEGIHAIQKFQEKYERIKNKTIEPGKSRSEDENADVTTLASDIMKDMNDDPENII